MSIAASASRWEEREEELRVLTRQGGNTYAVPDGLFDEDTFFARFEEFLVSFKVPKGRRLQLYNKLQESCQSIIRISQEICKHGSDNGRPESLVWKTTLAALEVSNFANGIVTFLTICSLEKNV